MNRRMKKVWRLIAGIIALASLSACKNPSTPPSTIADITSPYIGLLKAVPAGSFQRDFTSSNISVITTPFRIGEYEITRTQFLAILGTDPSIGEDFSGMSDPVQYVNWYHAIAFCNKLSIAEGLTPVYSVTESGNSLDFSILVFALFPL